MSIKLKGSTDGSVTLQAPADTSPTGTDKTLTLPTTTGSANQFVKNGGTAGQLEFSSMVEDSSGRVLIGTSTSPSGGDSHSQNAPLLIQGRIGSDADSGRINLQRGSAASSGSSIGTISFTDNSNNAYARLEVEADAATGSDDYPGRFKFSTTADGASSPTEAMRITSAGNVGIGTSSPGHLLTLKGTQAFEATNSTNDWLAYTYTDNTFRLNYNGAGADEVVITSAGKVGIGTDSPGQNLTIKRTGGQTQVSLISDTDQSGAIYFGDTASTARGVIEYDHTNDFMRLYTSGSEQMRIDTSGRLLIGTTSSTGSHKLEVNGGTDNEPIKVESSDAGAYIRFEDNDTTGSTRLGAVDNDFKIDVNSSERMRIDSLGRVGIKNSSPSSQYFNDLVIGSGTSDHGITLYAGSSSSSAIAFSDATSGTGRYAGYLQYDHSSDSMRFYTNGGIERMKIANDGSFRVVGVYNFTLASSANVHVDSGGLIRRVTSSAKYKTNIETIEDSYADALLNCRPVWYQSTCEGDNPDYSWWGFIAEEVAEIDPRLVHWKTTNVTYDENGYAVETPCEPEAEGVLYDRFVPHLVNLVKRQKTRIETLETQYADLLARVTALEAAE